jgi:hypothetical protein
MDIKIMGRDILRQNETPLAGLAALPAQQQQALAALLTGATVSSAAVTAGVARSTLNRWLTDDAQFIAEYNSARREMADAVGQALRLLSGEAVRVLEKVLTNTRTPVALKVRAAVEVLKMTAAPPEGPTDPQDARNVIAARDRKRMLTPGPLPTGLGRPGGAAGCLPGR